MIVISVISLLIFLELSSSAPCDNRLDSSECTKLDFSKSTHFTVSEKKNSLITENSHKNNYSNSNNRLKRYVLQGSRWRKRNLTYKIESYPKNLKEEDVDREIQRAFSAWSNVSALTFSQSKAKADIKIKFAHGKHGDEAPFDGTGGSYSHAFFPSYGSAVHFDASENWTVTGRGLSLYRVAVHEIGHALGLSHSYIRGSLMRPFYYNKTSFDFKMHSDDIDGIRALYGKNKVKQ